MTTYLRSLSGLGRPIALAFALAASIVLAASPAWGQDGTADDTEPTRIVVSEEPGTCDRHGSLCDRVLEWTGSEVLAETFAWVLGTPLRVLTIVVVAALANRIARRTIRRVASRFAELDLPAAVISEEKAERSRQRADAVGAMMRSTASALIFGIATVWILDILGMNVLPLLASLGIAGIAVGFGAQRLIEDLISGVMIVIEDQLGVGDRVDLGPVEGDVVRLTLRTTVIAARNGVRWYVPNSEIRTVANESKRKTRAEVKLEIAYSTDLREAASLLRQATLDLAAEPRWREAGIEDVRDPFVASLPSHAVVLEQRLFIEPTERRAFQRALLQRFVEVARDGGIELPNEQVDVWIREPVN